jgi:O-acetylhomoserine (thiol)-lyase
MERHSENALAVAEYLKVRGGVNWVEYPGLPDSSHAEIASRILKGGSGALVAFGIEGGREAGRKFIDSLELFSHLANIGDAKSLAIHPATTTHSQLDEGELASAGVTDDMVRLSVGIENISDILADIEQALAKAQ